MTKPVRLQLSRKRGFDLQDQSHAVNGLPAVSVARPGKWGNPFAVGSLCSAEGRVRPVADKSEAVRLYRKFAAPDVALQVSTYQELRGKNLACWCGPEDSCHADVLLEIANKESDDG